MKEVFHVASFRADAFVGVKAVLLTVNNGVAVAPIAGKLQGFFCDGGP